MKPVLDKGTTGFIRVNNKIYIEVDGTGEGSVPTRALLLNNEDHVKKLNELSFFYVRIGSEWLVLPHIDPLNKMPVYRPIYNLDGKVIGNGTYMVPSENKFRELRLFYDFIIEAPEISDDVTEAEKIFNFKWLFELCSLDSGVSALIPRDFIKGKLNFDGYTYIPIKVEKQNDENEKSTNSKKYLLYVDVSKVDTRCLVIYVMKNVYDEVTNFLNASKLRNRISYVLKRNVKKIIVHKAA